MILGGNVRLEVTDENDNVLRTCTRHNALPPFFKNYYNIRRVLASPHVCIPNYAYFPSTMTTDGEYSLPDDLNASIAGQWNVDNSYRYVIGSKPYPKSLYFDYYREGSYTRSYIFQKRNSMTLLSQEIVSNKRILHYKNSAYMQGQFMFTNIMIMPYFTGASYATDYGGHILYSAIDVPTFAVDINERLWIYYDIEVVW